MRCHAGVEAVLHILAEGVGRHCNNRNRFAKRLVAASDNSCRFKSVHDWHLDIHKNRVVIAGFNLLESLDKLLAVRVNAATCAIGRENRFKNLRIQLVVLRTEEVKACKR